MRGEMGEAHELRGTPACYQTEQQVRKVRTVTQFGTQGTGPDQCMALEDRMDILTHTLPLGFDMLGPRSSLLLVLIH